LVSDDEVALIFDPFTWEPRSEPLVNIRFNLELAEMRGIIDAAARDELFRCAQSQYFPERTYERMMRSAEGRVDAKTLQRLREFLKDEGRDFKMEDAMAALRRTKEMAEGGCK
ncbi:MAG: TfuA-related McrA-glycine thioamidation protein, partial [Methanothrix sp.]|nr:TfuA-related McrA-glycine thioamidation protein [Methanothrix sp.]